MGERTHMRGGKEPMVWYEAPLGMTETERTDRVGH